MNRSWGVRYTHHFAPNLMLNSMRLVSKAIYDQNMVFAIEKWPKMAKNYKQALEGTIYPSFCAKFDAEFNGTSFKGYL